MLTKKCQKCGGDLFVETDLYGTYLKCLQCGYTRDLTQENLDLIVLAGQQYRTRFGGLTSPTPIPPAA